MTITKHFDVIIAINLLQATTDKKQIFDKHTQLPGHLTEVLVMYSPRLLPVKVAYTEGW